MAHVKLQEKLKLDTKEAQLLRSQRTLLAIGASLGVLFVLSIMASAGMLAQKGLGWSAALITLQCLLFMGLIKSGLNRRFRDPSMTTLQTIGATSVLLLVAYHSDSHGHSVALLCIPIAFAFASFRYGTKRLLVLVTALALMSGVEVILRMTVSAHAGEAIGSLLAGVVAMVFMLLTLTAIGGQINDLRRNTQSERAASHLAMTKLTEAVLTVDLMHQIQFANTGAQALFSSYSPQTQNLIVDEICQFVGQRPLSDLLTETTIRATLDGVASSDAEKVDTQTLTGTIITVDGTRRDVELSISPLTSSRGALEGYVLVARDITESRRLMDELKHAASHDMLTGLLNRRGFLDVLSMAVSNDFGRNDHCVIVMDLDQFKIVNDACGHHAGDEVLRNVAAMMRATAPGDAWLARLGGDEFGIVLKECTIQDAQRLSERMIDEFSQMRFQRDGRTFKIGASIGVAQYSEDCQNVESLLTRADSACYLAKERGRNCVQIYSVGDEQVSRHQRDVSWVSRITEALENDRFVLYAQKMAPSSPDTDNRECFELLIRMRAENGDIILPDAFLPSAERFNMISMLDRQVIRLATRALAKCAQSGQMLPQVAINLSSSSLRDTDLVSFVAQSLQSSGLRGSLFTFELAESSAVFDLERAKQFFDGLKSLGCRIALDDVGSAFNSFYNLRQLPIDLIKIDGAYIRGMLESPLDRVLIESIHRIAAVLEVDTVAIHVENDRIRQAASEIGIDYLQGYGVHRPEPFDTALQAKAAGKTDLQAIAH